MESQRYEGPITGMGSNSHHIRCHGICDEYYAVEKAWRMTTIEKEIDEAAEAFWQDDLAKFMPSLKKCPDDYKIMFRAGVQFGLKRGRKETELLVEALDQIEDEIGPLITNAEAYLLKENIDKPQWNEITTVVTRQSLAAYRAAITAPSHSGGVK
jgi:hypothetical protein